MSDAPNNFPRMGEHNPITRENLDALETQAPEPHQEQAYTIGGSTEYTVHERIETERQYALSIGNERLEQVSNDVQTDHVFATQDGYAQTQFNAANELGQSYADMQREAAANAQSQQRTHDR